MNCPYILEKLPFDCRTRHNRTSNTFYLPTPRIDIYKYSPLYAMCSNYNRVSDEIDIFFCKIRDLKKLKVQF